ncbi:hypothetical protein [Humibacillus xanthopallidus]|uniref:Ig-like domain-containing protein n=1 Tax=Humibacillus xanthopallidus TaxID=412689 RepID=A0A543I1L0_9MICO|nr:hypothetical protein [Humibacillus xanthopallidus]TQM64445.1 hypothetical protein FBY41_0811 [Humibacillus xanthopallidus]
MPERRTRPTGWFRSACCAAAVLLLAGLLATPGAGALAAPRSGPGAASLFAVSVTPTAAEPGQDVTVSFTALNENLFILSCGATLDGRALPECTGSGGAWSVHFTLPPDARPATTTIAWALTYFSTPDSYLGAGPLKDFVDFTVLDPVDPAHVSFSLDRTSGRPGDQVVATFRPLDPKTTITTCSLLIAGVPFSDCAASDTDWSLPFTVPRGASAGSTPVEWSVVYERGEEKHHANGTATFTVLSPDAPTPTFSVSVIPGSTHADGTVTLGFSADDSLGGITGCSAQLEGVPLPDCQESGGAWSIRFTMPKDVAVGRHTITWQLTYARNTLVLDAQSDTPKDAPRIAVSGERKGRASVTVLPTVTATTTQSSSGSTTKRAGTGQGGTSHRSGSTGVAPGPPIGAGPHAVEPPVAQPVETGPIAWVRQHSELGLLLAVIALVVLAGLVLGSRGRPVRRVPGDRADDSPPGAQVWAVGHPGTMPVLVVRDTDGGRRSRTVRLAAQCPPASSDLKEVTS